MATVVHRGIAAFLIALFLGAIADLLHQEFAVEFDQLFAIPKAILDHPLASMGIGALVHAVVDTEVGGLWIFFLWPLAICKFHVMSGLVLEALWILFVVWCARTQTPSAGTSTPSSTG